MWTFLIFVSHFHQTLYKLLIQQSWSECENQVYTTNATFEMQNTVQTHKESITCTLLLQTFNAEMHQFIIQVHTADIQYMIVDENGWKMENGKMVIGNILEQDSAVDL